MSDASVKLRCLKTGELYDANTASFYSEHGGLFEVAIDFKDVPTFEEFDQRLMSRASIDRSGFGVSVS